MADTLPMPEPTVPNKSFTEFKSLSFDIYGTLIDWETSIVEQCKLLIDAAPGDSPYKKAATDASAKAAFNARFGHYEGALQTAHPTMRYDTVLRDSYLFLADEFGLDPKSDDVQSQAVKFGQSLGSFQPFPDTVDAMQRLGKYFKLVPLSNVDRASFAKTDAGPLKGVNFWRVYTAEDIGSYKPDLRNFEYLLKHLDEDDRSEGGSGISKEQNLMVAQSLFHDHGPSKHIGMASVWINRNGAGIGLGSSVQDLHDNGEVGYGWRYNTLGEFADAVEKDFAERK